MNPPSVPRNAPQALGAGRRLLAAGLAAEAVARLREAPESAERAFHLGAALLAAGRLKEAVATLLQATRERPQAPLAWLQIAVAEEKLGRPARAAVALRHAVRLRPQWKIARLRLAAAMLRIGRTEAAAEQAQAALRLDPGSTEARRLLEQARMSAAAQAAADATPAIVAAPVPRPPVLRPGIVDHVLIVRALILRDLRLKYRDNRFGFVMELARPVAVVVAHYYLFYLLRKPMPGKIPIEAFVIAGFSVWFAFNYAAQGAMQGGRWPGGATLLPGVTRLHMRIARAAWAVLINLVFCLTAALALSLYGDEVAAPSLPLTCLIFALAGCMGFGFGLSTACLGAVWPMIRPLEKLLTWALFVTSALYFCTATILPLLAEAMLYNPLLHLVEYERHAFDPGYPVALVSLVYPGCVAALLLLTGLAATRSLHGGGRLIHLLGVAKSFADPGHRPRVVFRPTSIALPHDRRVAILGGRGAGKTVLLHLLAGSAAPDRGQVVSPVRLSPVANSGFMLHPALSAIENIRVIGRMSGIAEAPLLRAVDALGGIGARLEQPLRSRTQGQRRALEAAIVTVLPFDCTLYDNVAQLPADLFARCLDTATRGGRGAIFATANVRVVRQFAENAVVIDDASVHVFGRVADGIAFFERSQARIGSWAGLPAMTGADPGLQGERDGRGPA